MKKTLFSLLSLLWCATSFATVWNSDGTPGNIQSLHDNSAVDGDTITIPGGSYNWTTGVNITKFITIAPTNGKPVITDNISKTGSPPLGAFRITLGNDSGTKVCRISGLDIEGGSTPDYTGSQGEITISVTSTAPDVRIDGNTFNNLKMRPICTFGGPWIVIDHNTFTMNDFVGGIELENSNWGGVGDYGDNAWFSGLGHPHWGTAVARPPAGVFIEDNKFNNFSSATAIDGDSGLWVVVRHNTFACSEIGNHGTETGQRHRSGAIMDIYKNNFDGGVSPCIHNWTVQVRGGTMLFWGNYSDRYDSLVKMICYRLRFPATPWGIADGTNGWDSNDTTDHSGNGYGGGPGGVFATGTATSSTTNGQLIDTNQNFPTTNMWLGYSIRNLTQSTASVIKRSDTHSATVEANPQGAGTPIPFNTGDSYEFRKVITVFDEPGSWPSSVLLSGANPTPPPGGNPDTENVDSQIFVWGNTLGPHFGNGNGQPVIVSDYTTTNWSYSTATGNEGARAGYVPDCYPHPLVSGSPCQCPFPDPPTSLVVNSFDSHSVTVTWNTNFNSSSLPFALTYVPGGTGPQPVWNYSGKFIDYYNATLPPATLTEMSQTSLNANTWYQLYVSVYNSNCGAAGQLGTPSNSVIMRTNP